MNRARIHELIDELLDAIVPDLPQPVQSDPLVGMTLAAHLMGVHRITATHRLRKALVLRTDGRRHKAFLSDVQRVRASYARLASSTPNERAIARIRMVARQAGKSA